MAKEIGISISSVQRIWRAHKLQPHRVRSFKLSRDPEFEALDQELRRYLNSVTSKLIRDEVYADTSEAAEVDVACLSAG